MAGFVENVNNVAQFIEDVSLAELQAIVAINDEVVVVANNAVAVDTISNNILAVAAVAGAIPNIIIANTSIADIDTVATNIVGVNGIASNLAEILLADTNAATATAKANEASISAVNASVSAATATTKSSEASISATNGANSATNAANSASAASISASTANINATNASASATNAANSATSASTSMTSAINSANSASTHATDANISSSNANISSTSASGSATSATTKASEANTSASEAATSASNATVSATNAANSAISAANSAISAANSAISAANSVDNSYARDGSKPLTADFAGGGYKITNIINGTASSDGATYGQVSTKVNKAGDTMTGQLKGITPVAIDDLTRKDYVDLKVNRAGDTMTGNLEVPSISVGGEYLNPATQGNYIIDGRFDFWYEATSQTTSGFGSDTMWNNAHYGSTKTHSQQAFTTGGSFPDGTPYPLYFSRTTVTSVAAAGNYVLKEQKTEDVTRLAGKTVTLSFYAKADAARNIAIEFVQYFGSGGPSATITSIGMQKIPITTAWQKFTRTITIPSTSGKTLGTDGVQTSSTALYFWFDAGSSYNTRSDTLGQQSGTFDIARVILEEGTVATPFGWGGIAAEEHKIRRYYREDLMNVRAYQGGAGYMDAMIQLSPPMRAIPTTTIATPTSKAASVDTWYIYAPSANELRVRVHNTAAGDMYAENMAISADARFA